MSSSPRFRPSSGFLIAVLVLLLQLAMPRWSHAIQLFWSNGTPALSVAEATRAVLIVKADSAEGVLPDSWKLIWTADSSGVRFAPLDALAACEPDTAGVLAIDLPATAVDSAANEITAHFCSTGSSTATTAYYLVDLIGGSKGKLKVIALAPADSMTVRESNEVTYNGGVEGSYAPNVLKAMSTHQSLELRVTAIGSGLSGASSLRIMATDSSWSLPLAVMSRSETSLTGLASVAALLPACQVAVGSEAGAASAAMIPPDEEPTPESPQSCGASYFENLLQPPPFPLGFTIQPKDFAFVRGFVDQASHRYALHLFYIRHNYWYYPPPPAMQHPELDEKNLGHIWTTDFTSWYGPGGLNKPDTLALKVRPGKFDEFHVWAPSIVSNGPYFHMFYTGVRVENGRENQRIGVATSTDLITWTPSDAPVLTSPQIEWASKDPVDYDHAQQLRDPFVMEDPLKGGQWLMYFVAVDSMRSPKMAVGVAKSTDLLNWTALDDPFSAVERPTFQGATTRVESPHVFRRNGQWWMPYTVDGDQIFFETTASADPTDTVATHWTNPIWMRSVTEGQPPELQYWHASEHLRINSTEYLAAFNDNAIAIDIKGVFTPANPVDSLLLSCPELAGVDDREGSDGGVRMAVTRMGWGTPEVGLRLELPARMAVRLAVYDIAGRRRTTLLDRVLPGGTTEVTWRGQDEGGARLASGMYFVRLTFPSGARVSKLVMLH